MEAPALPDAAFARLDAFRWEWVRENDTNGGAEWVAARNKPVTCPAGINAEGLEDAAHQAARYVQARLHAQAGQPLHGYDAGELWGRRLAYQNALYWLDSTDELWKTIEAKTSPDGIGRTICIGSNKPTPVTVTLHGQLQTLTLGGYPGCYRPFPETPYGRGYPTARWCPSCKPAQSNAKSKAITELRQRAASTVRSNN